MYTVKQSLKNSFDIGGFTVISEKLKEVAGHVANRNNCGTVGNTMALSQVYLSIRLN